MAHGEDTRAMRQILAQLAPMRGGCLWTGAVHGRIRAIRKGEAHWPDRERLEKRQADGTSPRPGFTSS